MDTTRLLTSVPAKGRAGLAQLLQFIEADSGWSDTAQLAYFLATVEHETAHTFRSIPEYGGASKSYGQTGYYGRGYPQLTHKANYLKAGQKLGLGDELVRNPDRALDPTLSYEIASRGMREGWFTGVGLGRYINANKVDYVNARRVINGLDRAEQIAARARQWEALLGGAGEPSGGGSSPVLAVAGVGSFGVILLAALAVLALRD